MNRYLSPLISFFLLLSVSLGRADAQTIKQYTNPILVGFYPDPSICKVDNNYYLVNSTFAYFPGITVFKSKDLVHWDHIGDVLSRPEQLDLDSAGVSRGIFAPAIRYYEGLFYITCTLVDKGGNFVVTAKNPAGPWSNPVWLPQIDGIDPSLFFDDNAKAYLIYNSVAPDNKPLYDGHRTIRIHEFDYKNLEVIGEEKILINGGTDISKKPVWIEGPHIFKKDGFYYLIAAEGGTAYNHSEVVFRSKDVYGPYISYKGNPILTQRTLDPNRKFPITSTGHADFVETQNGSWWAVFLGCRPYEDDIYNTGRETFLAPVKWENGWPVITTGNEEVKYFYPYPLPEVSFKSGTPYSGNFTMVDNFNKKVLNKDWVFLKTPSEKWYNLSEQKGYLTMKLRPETCSGKMNPSFLGHRQQHLNGSASVAMNFFAKAGNEKAGILIFQNEDHFYFMCKSIEDNVPVIQLYKSDAKKDAVNKMELLTSEKLNMQQNKKELYLKIEAKGKIYSFLYAFEKDEWKTLKDNVDATYLSTKVAGGFVGCMYALYATSLGEKTDNAVYYDWFKYSGDDAVYKNTK